MVIGEQLAAHQVFPRGARRRVAAAAAAARPPAQVSPLLADLPGSPCASAGPARQ